MNGIGLGNDWYLILSSCILKEGAPVCSGWVLLRDGLFKCWFVRRTSHPLVMYYLNNIN